MRSYLLLSVLLFLFYACMPDEGAPVDNNKDTVQNLTSYLSDSSRYTTIHWKDTNMDFGQITKDESVDIKFICTNTGSTDLVLSNVRPSCGCTLADYSKIPIQPGKTGYILAKYDSKKSAHGGKVTKTINYDANARNNPKKLTFTGFVKEDGSSKK